MLTATLTLTPTLTLTYLAIAIPIELPNDFVGVVVPGGHSQRCEHLIQLCRLGLGGIQALGSIRDGMSNKNGMGSGNASIW